MDEKYLDPSQNPFILVPDADEIRESRAGRGGGFRIDWNEIRYEFNITVQE